MGIEQLTQNWALVAAAMLGIVIAAVVLMALLRDSARGRLSTELGHLQDREKAQRKAQQAVEKATKRLRALQATADTAKPRLVDEAADNLQGAETELRLIDDHVLIARNRVRTVILEEYPPKRHAAMRRRFLNEAE